MISLDSPRAKEVNEGRTGLRPPLGSGPISRSSEHQVQEKTPISPRGSEQLTIKRRKTKYASDFSPVILDARKIETFDGQAQHDSVKSISSSACS